ncbi:MAG: endonuclease domain-containing protein [Kiloniellales bacterium]|nr:endonuclease domain-containing protein [Kiloniellales bacterium]
MTRTEQARALRPTSTPAERHLWKALRNRQISGQKFKRQFRLGPYIADFVCLERSLVVELDGGHHSETEEYDQQRTEELNRLGFRVLRFWNNEVLQNLDGVVRAIEAALAHQNNAPSPRPSPKGEGD